MCKQIYTETPFNFTKRSTIGCGGFAETAYYPCDEREVLALISTLKDNWVVVGNLSNVLPPDEGIKQAVICTKRLTDIFPVSGVNAEPPSVADNQPELNAVAPDTI